MENIKPFVGNYFKKYKGKVYDFGFTPYNHSVIVIHISEKMSFAELRIIVRDLFNYFRLSVSWYVHKVNFEFAIAGYQNSGEFVGMD
jgi:hypothetical protein